MASVYPRPNSPYWWISYTVAGQRHREPTTIRHDNRRQPSKDSLVWDIIRQLEERLARQKFGLSAALQVIAVRVFLAEFMALYRTELEPKSFARYQQMCSCLAHWCEANGVASVQELDYKKAADFVTQRKGRIAPASVRAEVTLFKKAWVEAKKKHYCEWTDNPWTFKIKVGPTDKKPFSAAELEAIFAMRMPLWLRTCCVIALYTGARSDSIKALGAEHIGLDLGVINFLKSKTGPYWMPLHPVLQEFLSSINLPAGPILPADILEKCDSYFSATFTAWTERPVARGGAGFHGNFHQFRHTFNTRVLEAGVSRTAVMKLMNHKSERSNEVYTHVDAMTYAGEIARLTYGTLKTHAVCNAL